MALKYTEQIPHGFKTPSFKLRNSFFIKIFFLVSILIRVNFIYSQTLNLPPRSTGAKNGAQVISAITNLSLKDRENYIFNEIINGNVPDFYRNMVLVTDSALISGVYKKISYYVIPDYLALGHDTNYFLCPMTPVLAQKIADSTGCMLPTRKMVNRIWTSATLKLAPQTIAPSSQMTTVPVFSDHNNMVWSQRQPVIPSFPLGNLTGGDKKDVVISNQIYTLPPPNRVLIYGWHQLNGSPIQPLYGGHDNLYADYSHGIRLVQKNMWLDTVATTAQTILASSTLNILLSDEGVINIPFYPDTASGSTLIPSTPQSFCVINETSTSLRVKIKNDPNVTTYKVYLSSDGNTFTGPTSFSSANFVISGLTANAITYVKLQASNSNGVSANSEVLAAVPSSATHEMLVVNGFDRAVTGNTYNFIRQHGKAIFNYGYAFSSATNEAVTDGIISINNYYMADYILGKESTANETFSSNEQTFIKSFLDGGGKLFVSGSEIGWDLDYKGAVADKDFYHQYLKAQYAADAPNNQPSTYYQCTDVTSSVFNGLGNTNFDNGSSGTYNVDYPDVISAVNGSAENLFYTGLPTNYAGVNYEGLFPNGTKNGKLVNMGFPFETIYPDSSRDKVMKKILDFFKDSIFTAPPLTASFSSVSGVCPGQEISFSNSSSGGIPAYSFNWDFGDGTSASSVPNPSHFYSSPGNYNVTLLIMDSTGNTDDTTISVAVLPKDSASFYYTSSVFCTQSANPVAVIYGTLGGYFSETSGNVVFSDYLTGEIDMTASSTGSYTIQYITSGSCPDTAYFSITLAASADASFNGVQPLCVDDSPITLIAVNGGGVWSGNGITDSINGVFDPATAGAGSHPVYYIISGNCGDSDSVVVMVNALPAASVAGGGNICYGDTALLTASGGSSFLWNNGDTSQSVMASPASITVYVVTVTENNCSASVSDTIFVNPLPTALFGYAASGNGSIVQFSDSSSGSVSWLWDFSDGDFSTNTNPLHFFASEGNYWVCLTVSSNFGCKNNYCDSVTVLLTGVEENSKNLSVRLYPVPSKNAVTVEWNIIKKNPVISISDIAGQEILRKIAAGNFRETLSLEGISPGTYILRLVSGEETIVKKLIVY